MDDDKKVKRSATSSGLKEPPNVSFENQSLTSRFMSKLEGLEIPEEEKSKIVLISQYILSAAKVPKPNYASDSAASYQEDMTLQSQNLPVHIVTLPIPESGVVFSLVEAGRSDRNDIKSPSSSANLAMGKENKDVLSPRGVIPTSHSLGDMKNASSLMAKDDLDVGLIPRRFVDGVLIPVDGSSLRAGWRPKGLLVANLHEHAAAVNKIQVSGDNQFFATCSDDGSVKIWDCQRLEKNVTNRSRLTYATQGGKITCLTMCENSHSIASGSTNGSIHVFRVDYGPPKKEITRFTGAPTIYMIDKTEGAIVNIDHFNIDNFSQSVIVYATAKGKIHAHDLRAKKEAWLLCNPANAGLIRSFMVDPSRNWLVVGTSRGFYTCWDIRFNLPVKTWRQPEGSPIYSLKYFTSKEGLSLVAAASGLNSVYVWDVESSLCRYMFRVIGEDFIPPSLSNTSIAPPPPPLKPIPLDSKPHHDFGTIDSKVMASLNTADLVSEPPVIRALFTPPDSSYFITGGTDRRIRYWDILSPSQSYTITGTDKSTIAKPKYFAHTEFGATILEEFPPSYSTYFGEEGQTPTPTGSTTAPSPTTPQENKSKTHLPSVNHSDCILDIQALELPHQMLISSSRDGSVKVWK
eukprot:TRINITY_DN4425_c0_g1_i2.p1 TRINITY_DN4425_c0_g1~~TRINITY_DN4425_c0_g1_i2.p1  ORF type:complete len:680 (+),score=156.94 TRINITY_DN4425_c0_g1_i2:145-2040(+)